MIEIIDSSEEVMDFLDRIAELETKYAFLLTHYEKMVEDMTEIEQIAYDRIRDRDCSGGYENEDEIVLDEIEWIASETLRRCPDPYDLKDDK